MDYWTECISVAFGEEGITATKEQIENVAGAAEGAHENFGLATGRDCIPNPLLATVDELKRTIKQTEAAVDKANSNFRKNVAMRRRCSEHDVMLGEDGHAEISR